MNIQTQRAEEKYLRISAVCRDRSMWWSEPATRDKDRIACQTPSETYD
jgi:hypothetical protein